MGVIIRQSIKGTLVNYAGAIIGAFTTLFATTVFLTESEIGLMRTLITAGELFSGLAMLGTCSSVLRYYPFFKDASHKDHGFFFWTLVVPLVGYCLYGLIFMVFKADFCGFFEKKSPMLIDFYYFTFPLAFFILYTAVFETNANVLMRIVVPKFFREVGLRLLQLGDYALYATHVIEFRGFILILCCTYGIVTLLDFCYLVSFKKISFKPDFAHITPELRSDYLRYTAFVSTHAIVNTLAPTISTFLLGVKVGLASTGIYTIALYISRVIEMPYRSLGAISSPLVSQHMKDGDITAVNRLGKEVSLHQFMIASMLFFLLYTNIDLIYRILPNGDTFALGRNACVILGLHYVISTTLNIGFSVLGYSRYYYMFLVFSLVLTLSGFWFNSLLIPLYSTSGGAAATLLSNLLYFALLCSFIGWKLHFSVFSLKHAKVLGIMVLLALIYHLYAGAMQAAGLALKDLPVGVALVEALLRSAVLTGAAVTVCYKMRISEPANHLLEKMAGRFVRRRM